MTNLKTFKRALALLLTVLMIVGVVPFAAFAEDSGSNITIISNKTTVFDEKQLIEAIAGTDTTIVIGKDIELTDTLTIPADKKVTLDLNGKTLSQTKEQTAGYQMILNDGKLTIKDSSTAKSGKISYTDSGNGGEYISDTIYNRGVLVIDGGTIENLSSATVASNGYPHAVDTYSGIRNTSVTVNGGTIYCKEYSAIRMFCVSATYKADLVINNGYIKGAVDMQNGTKPAANGSLTVNGGVFETTANANNIRFANWNGGATEYGIVASIKGGTFNGGITTKYVPAAANWNCKIITGGTFTADVTEFLKDGYVQNANGTVSNPKLPNATVSLLTPLVLTKAEHSYMVWPSGDATIDRPLQIVMNFKANDTLEQAQASNYGKYVCDFYLSLSGLANGSIEADGCYLAGNYGTFGWIVIPTDDLVLEEGVEYPVVSAYDANLTYENICDYVKDFIAAIYVSEDILAANPDFKVTLSLKMKSPDGTDVVTIGTPAEYTVNDLLGKSAVGSDGFADTENAPAIDAAREQLKAALEAEGVSDTDAAALVANAAPVIKIMAAIPDANGVIVYDVSPVLEAGNASVKISTFAKAITFRLDVPASETKTFAKVYHEGELIGVYNIVEENGKKYVEVSSKNFSEFKVEPTEAPKIEVTDANGNKTYYAGFEGFSSLELSNCVIKLLGDVSDKNLILNKGTAIDTNVVLDLNGYTFSRAGSDSGAISLTQGAGLTVRDTSVAKTGKIIADTYAVWIMNGDFVLESGTIESTSTTNPTIYANATSMEIRGGKIIAEGNAISIGDNFIESRGVSTVSVTGGEIVAKGNGIIDGSYCQATTSVSVTDGKITAGEGKSALSLDTANTEVSGGTFSSDVSDYCVDGFECKVNPDGSYGVAEDIAYVAMIGTTGYATFAESIAAALEAAIDSSAAEVKLIADIVLADTLTIPAGKSVVLDLNGHTLTYNSTTQGEAMITNKGDLTINDSVGTGVIDYNYTGVADPSFGKGNYTISNAGKLTVNGGKITIANLRAHAKYPIDNNSTTGDAILVINGGHLYNYNTSAIRQFCNSTTYKNSVTVNGGLVEGYCSIWVQNPGSNTVNASLSITGGEIKTTAAAYVNGTSDLKDVSSSIYFTISGDDGAWSTDSVVSITGGTFNENVDLAEETPASITIDESATFNGYVEVPKVYVAEVNGVKYESLLAALEAAIDSSAAEVKLLADTREVMPTDVELLLKADLKLVSADGNPVSAKFYNNGTNYDFIINSADPFNECTFTVGENVTFELEDRVIWAGYYGNDVTVVVDGTLAGYQYWHGADTTVNATGTLKTTGEALVMRRGATLSVDGGKVEANYFNILAGNIFAENGANITCGAFWIANSASYTGEGNVSINIWDSTLTSSGNLKSSTASAYGVSIDIYNSTVSFNDFDGYGASQLDEKTTLDVNGGNANLTVKSLVNNGTIDVYDNASMTVNNFTNNSVLTVEPGSSFTSTNAGASVAQIGNTYYGTLADAIDAASEGDTVVLINDVVVNQTVLIDERIMLDLNGHTLSTDTASVLLQIQGANFWLQNNASTGASVINTANGGVAIYNQTAMVVGNQNITISAANGTALKSVGPAMIGGGNWVGALDITADPTMPFLTTSISGGTFTADPTEWVSESSAVVKNSDNSYGVVKAVASVNGVGYTTLQAAIDAAQTGDVVTLLADVTLSETLTVETGKTLTLDLNGKTVSMEQSATVTANHQMILNKGNLTIKDSVGGGKLSYTYTGANLGTTYSVNTITSNPGSILTVESGTIENLTYDNSVIAYAIDGLTNGGAGDVTVNINGGTITGMRQAVRIFANSTTNTGILNISGGDITGRVIVQNASAKANKAALTITGGTFTANAYKADVLYVGGSLSDSIEITASVSGGTFNGEITDTNVTGFITGGTFTTDVSELCAAGYYVNDNGDGTYGVVEGLMGSGTEADPYLIRSLTDLIWFRDTVNTYTSDGSNQFKGKYVKLTTDIDLAGINNWKPIGDNDKDDHEAFLGHFDGDGHVISNLYINADGGHLGLFARVGSYNETESASVKNLILRNVDVWANVTDHWTPGHGDYVAALIANAGGNTTVSGITLEGYIYIDGCAYVGGIVGHGYTTIDNCSVNAAEGSYIMCGYWSVGAIMGYGGEGTTITNSSVTSDANDPLYIWGNYGAAAAILGNARPGSVGDNLTASNVIISGDDYALGYLFGNAGAITNSSATNVTLPNGADASDAVAMIGNQPYFDINSAIKSAQSGEVVEILAGTFNEAVKITKLNKNITIKGADNFGTTLTGGISIGIDDNNNEAGSITIEGINFTGKGVTLYDLANVTISGNKFTDITSNVDTPAIAAIYVSCDNYTENVVISENEIENVLGTGIRVRSAKNITIDGNTVAGTSDNAITLESSLAANNGTVVITNNTLSDWANNSNNEGRAIRISNGNGDAQKTVTIEGNVMLADANAVEEYAKITGAPSAVISIDRNYWDGKNPNAAGVVNVATQANNYYADATLTELVTIAYVARNTTTGVGYESFAAAIAAANADETITLLADVTESSVIMLDKSVVINGNNYTVTSGANRVFRVIAGDVEVTLNNVNMVSTAVVVYPNDVRGISIDNSIANVNLTLNNCTVDFTDATANDWAYAINVTGGSDHTVTVNGGSYEGANVINVRGSNSEIVVKDAVLTSTYPMREGNTQYGACIYVIQGLGTTVTATGTTFNGNNAVAFNVGSDPAPTESNNIDNTTRVVAKIGTAYYVSIAAAIAAAQAGDVVTLLADVTLTSKFILDKAITIDGNEHSIIADANTTWHTVSGKLQIKNYAPWVVLKADGIVLENLVINSNGVAGGVKVENADDVVFDNVSILGAKADALTVVGSVDFKTYLKIDTTSSVIDARNGVVTAEDGTVFDMTKFSGSVSPATSDLTGAVDTNGESFFCAYSSTTYYKNTTNLTSATNLTLLKDIELTKDLSVKGTLDLNGNTLTLADGKTIKTSGDLTVINGTVDADFVLTSTAQTITGPEGLNVTTTVADHRVVYADGVYKVVEIIYVAQIGTERYESLADAIAAVQNGDTITLLRDCAEKVTVTQKVDVSFTIDGNGKTFTGKFTVKGRNNDGAFETLTIKNFKFTTETAKHVFIDATTNKVQNLTVDGCSFNTEASSVNAIKLNKTGNTTVSNCTADGVYYLVYNTAGGSNLTVENCKSTSSYGIRVHSAINSTIKNVELTTSYQGIIVDAGNASTLTLEGVKVTTTHAEGRAPVYVNGSNEAVISIVDNGGNTFTANAGMDWLGVANSTQLVKVISDNNVASDAKSLVAKIGNVYYNSLAYAIEEVAEGGTVTLVNDVALTTATTVTNSGGYKAIFNITKALTVDFNGNTVTVDANAADLTDAKNSMLLAVFATDTNGTLTLKDSASNGGVTVNANDAIVYALVINYGSNAKIFIEGGEYTLDKVNASLIYSQTSQTVTVNGGKFHLGNLGTAANGSPWIFNVKGNNIGHIIVNGGTFNADVMHQHWEFEVQSTENVACKSNGDGTWTMVPAVVTVGEKSTSSPGYTKIVGYATLADAIAAAQAGEVVTLLEDIVLGESITIAADKAIVLDLAGKTLSGTDTTAKSFSLITNKGELTVMDSVGNGKITLNATQNTGYSRYSTVISNTVGGKLVIESGTVEHLGGHTMAYAIDNLTNGKGTYAETVINGGTVKSTYVGIRQFLNGVEAYNILTVNGGTVTGDNTSIFFQDPSANCNSGKLVVGENATLGNRIYVSGTAGTPWDVELSVSAQALGTYGITTDEIPATCVIKEVNGVYGFVAAAASVNGIGYATITEAIKAAADGQTVEIFAGTYDEVISIAKLEKNITIKGADNFATTLTGGISIGTDDNKSDIGSITVEGINFIGKGVNIDELANVTIKNNKFTDITDIAAIRVICDNFTENTVISGNVINNVTGGAGIRVRSAKNITVDSNTVAGTKDNSITLESSLAANDGTVVITNNVLSDWANNGENTGRAIRISNGTGDVQKTVTIEGNAMLADTNATEEYAKITGAASAVISVDENYWDGKNPGSVGIVTAETLATSYYASYEDGALGDLTAIDYVAKIGEQKFISLAEAIAAAQSGDVITLNYNITITDGVTVPAGMTLTLDLNGKTLTGAPETAAAFAVITNRGNLTVMNGAIVCDHKLAGSTAYAVNTITNCGTLTIDGATVENKSTAANQIGYAIDNNSIGGNAILVIESGKVTASGSGYYDAIRMFCGSEVNENSVTVNGGEVSSIWMQNASDGNTEKNTKDVKGSVTITGGTVNALYLEPSAAFDATISGGYIGLISKFQTADGRDLAGFITGGTFANPVAEAYCANGYIPKDNGDGTYGVKIGSYVARNTTTGVGYETLADAMAAADGDVVTLLVDITIADTVKIEKKITLDLGGKTVTATSKKAFEIYANATIKNGTIVAVNRCVDTRKAVELTLTDLELVANEYTTAYGNPQPITVGGSDNGTKVTMTNVSIDAGQAGYAIITFVKTELNATNSNIGGYSALYVKAGSEDSVFTFNNCALTGDLTNNDVEGNSMAVINVEAGDVTVDVVGGTVTAKGNNSYAIGINPASGNKVTVTGTISGNILAVNDVTANTVILPAAYAGTVNTEGYATLDNGNGTVTVVKAVAKVVESGKLYATITDAIKGAADGQTVEIFAGTFDEYIAPWATDTTHASEKSITIVGAADGATVLTGGMYLGYDDSQNRGHKITVKGITFEGKGLIVAGQGEVIIEGNTFKNITACVANPSTADANAISVVGKDVVVTVKNNEIDTVAVAGINLRNTESVTVTGNTVKNTGHNAITIQNNSANGAILIENNVLDNWGTNGEGRAVRSNGGSAVTITGNVMTHTAAPEEFVKALGSASPDLSANYWNGISPITFDAVELDSGIVVKRAINNYYSDAEKTNLVQLWNALVSIGEAQYEDLIEAIEAAGDGDVIKLITNINLAQYIVVDKNVNIDLNGFELKAKGLIELENGSVIDTGATKGILRVPDHRLVMTGVSYPMLPVWNNETDPEKQGYFFVTVKDQHKLTETETGFEYIFRPSLEDDTALNTQVFGDGAANNGLSIVVDLKLYKDGHLMAIESFIFEDDLIASVYETNAKVLKLTVKGISTFEKVEVEYKIISDTGLEFVSEAVTVVPTPATPAAPAEDPVEDPVDDPANLPDQQ